MGTDFGSGGQEYEGYIGYHSATLSFPAGHNMAAVAPALTSPFQAGKEKDGRIKGQARQTQCVSSQAQDNNFQSVSMAWTYVT